ncbi:hypothetical protein Plhal304r1_c023g0080351 [Plasmopara halstedii]
MTFSHTTRRTVVFHCAMATAFVAAKSCSVHFKSAMFYHSVIATGAACTLIEFTDTNNEHECADCVFPDFLSISHLLPRPSRSTASVVDNYPENAIVFHRNALPCFEHSCVRFDSKTYPNACICQVHTSASATSLSESENVFDLRPCSFSYRRTGTIYSNSARNLDSSWNLLKLNKMKESLTKWYAFDQRLEHNIHPYAYLTELHDDFSTWDKRLIKFIKSL